MIQYSIEYPKPCICSRRLPLPVAGVQKLAWRFGCTGIPLARQRVRSAISPGDIYRLPDIKRDDPRRVLHSSVNDKT